MRRAAARDVQYPDVAARDQVWVALLRGINLGRNKRIAMADLRAAYEAAGCGEVRTYIVSGNVVFTSDTGVRRRAVLAKRLEAAVEDTCGVAAWVALRTAAEIAAVVDAHPFGGDTSSTYVTFLQAKPSAAAVRRLEALDVEPDLVAVVGTEVYVRYPNGLANGRLTGALLDKTLGMQGTNRNWRTVTRLAEMARA
jgi:uncharacterized protein (DUF1697 family)